MKYVSIFAAAYALFTSYAQVAPLTFNTALPLSQGEFIFREQLVATQSDDVRDPSQNRMSTILLSSLAYGITPNLAIFGTISTDRILKNTTGAMRNTSGISDGRLFARYTIYKDDFQGGTFRVAPFAGLIVPSGTYHELDRLGILPINIPTGTGSWDIFGGIVATYGTVAWELDGQIGYQQNTEAYDFESGNIARADISFQYRLFPETLSSNTNYFVNGILEANLIKKDRNNIAGITDFDSGGTTLFLVPGLQYVSERYIAEISVQIPVVQHLNGTALENDFIFRTGFRINF